MDVPEGATWQPYGGHNLRIARNEACCALHALLPSRAHCRLTLLQGFAEKLFSRLQGTTEKFETRLALMTVSSWGGEGGWEVGGGAPPRCLHLATWWWQGRCLWGPEQGEESRGWRLQ